MPETAAIKNITLPSAASEDLSVFVDEGVVVAVLDKVPAQQQQDALNWLLFAQLAADRQKNRVQDADAWLALFRDFADKIGFEVTEGTTSTPTGTGSVSDLITEQFKSTRKSGSNELSAALGAVGAIGFSGGGLQAIARDQGLGRAHVLAGVVSVDTSAGLTIIELVALQCRIKPSEHHQNILRADITDEKTTVVNYRFTLKDTTATTVRSALEDKLGMLAQEKIYHVPLGN
ncbi:hypothetical protein [Streptomyces flaveolus]|uniref:hypothetical protein n=1 Tax=Streptomyces flaveolus TaxID=67297 RepID=UPI0036FB2C16